MHDNQQWVLMMKDPMTNNYLPALQFFPSSVLMSGLFIYQFIKAPVD